ncbi:MAG: PAS domain-containing protein, partial [Flavobacteriales bacterium]|nr:PAS domain-containing protein [Flavobacteriales bacterium]
VEKAEEMMQLALKNTSHRFEWMHTKSSGEVFPVEVLLTRISNEPDNRVIHCVWRDITGRKNKEEEQLLTEQRLKEAQSVAKIGSFEGDIYNDELWWSDELYHLFGLNPDEFEVTKDSFNTLLHPEDEDEYLAELMTCLETGSRLKRRFRGKHSSGEWLHYETVAEMTCDDTGKIIGMRGTVQDITERKGSENRLLESENRFRTLIENSPICIHEIDLDGKIVSMNKSGLDMLGVDSEQEVCGLAYLDAVESIDRPAIELLLDNAMKGTGSRFEFQGANVGKPVYYSSSFVPIKNKDGDVVRIMGMSEDVTERRLAEQELQFNADWFERWKSSNFIGILQSSADGGIADANDTMLEMLGYTKKDLQKGKLDWTKWTPPEFLHLDEKAIEESTKKGFWTPFEKEYFHKDGHRVPIMIGGSIFKERSDEFIVFVIDLSDTKKAERELKGSEERLQLLFESA